MKVCIATGTRAEYGLLKPLIKKISAEDAFTLQLIVTGAHLSPEFGLTYRQIEADGYKIDAKVEMLLSSDTPEGITKSMGLGMIGYADALKRLSPDFLIILGDRYEMLSVASTALIFRIPIVHIHGGELTEGAYDDAIRHAITKMSALHFTSTEVYRKRVIQLGEDPKSVFNVGAIGLDNFKSLSLLSKSDLENELNIKFNKYNYLVGFHPETLSNFSIETQFEALLRAIDTQTDSFFIFTKANADTNGRIINQMMEKYVSTHPEKAALEAFSKNTAREWGQLGIRSNIIVPGFMETAMSSTLSDEQKDRIYKRTSLKKATSINSVAETVAFLLSDKAESITGQNIHVDNGTI